MGVFDPPEEDSTPIILDSMSSTWDKNPLLIAQNAPGDRLILRSFAKSAARRRPGVT
jgi:hypothetical protein